MHAGSSIGLPRIGQLGRDKEDLFLTCCLEHNLVYNIHSWCAVVGTVYADDVLHSVNGRVTQHFEPPHLSM